MGRFKELVVGQMCANEGQEGVVRPLTPETWAWALDRPLILLWSEAYDGQLMTSEAYAYVLKRMDGLDLECHTATPIDPVTASALYDTYLTLEDVGGRL